MAFRKENYAIGVYTDTSEQFGAGIVMQTSSDQLSKNIESQEHEPMAFLGGRFAEAQKSWRTYEKKAYAIFQVFDRMDYLF